MTSTNHLVSKKAALEAELARAEAKAYKVEREQMAAELTALEREQAEVIPPLQKATKATHRARLKTELLLKSQREAELQAAQELTRQTNLFYTRIAQIKRKQRDIAPAKAARF